MLGCHNPLSFRSATNHNKIIFYQYEDVVFTCKIDGLALKQASH